MTLVSSTNEDVVAGISTPDNFITRFQEPFILAGKSADNKGEEVEQQLWEMALIEWRGFNSIDNVNAALYNNHIIEYSNGGPPIQVIIPDGIYNVAQINAEVRNSLVANTLPPTSIVITPNTAQGKIQIQVAAGFTVNLNASNIYSFFGFTLAQSPIVGATTVLGANKADFANGVAAYLLRCDAITGTALNANASDVMYIYTPNNKPNASINISPSHPVFLPLKNNKEIRSIRVYVTDDRGRRVSYRGEQTTYQLEFRRVQRKIY
jgi:hypothetical protein